MIVRNGCRKKVIKLFEETKYIGIYLNDVTFISVLPTYSHVVLVKEGY